MSKIEDMSIGLALFRDSLNGYVIGVLADKSDDILERVKEQLFEGIGGSGEPLEPGYENDPFFGGDVDRARRFMRWKEHVSGYRAPERGVNLYINGAFHDSMYVDLQDDGIKVTSPMENPIMEKWGVENFAPTDDWMEANVKEELLDKLLYELRESLSI